MMVNTYIFKKFICFGILLSAVFACQKKSAQQESPPTLARWVNPFIGTDGPGNTYPGATVPFGMVQLSPDIGVGGWDRIAGYYYQDTIITGFSHTHLSGTGAGDLYDVLLMPTNSRSRRRIKANGNRPFSRFYHKDEQAWAGFYQVLLADYGIEVSLTATPRVGIHRYRFPKDKKSQVRLDLGYALNWDKTLTTHIKVVNKTTIVGHRKSTGWAKKQQVFFVITSSQPFKEYNLLEAGKKAASTMTHGADSQLILAYDTDQPQEVVLKVALSSVSIEGAMANLKAEAHHFNFDAYVQQAENLWNEQLGKITIDTDDIEQKKLFYTMLYQSMLAPTLYSDVSGRYHSANQGVQQAQDFLRYDTFSLWDTYRAAHPLYTLLHPHRSSDMIKSLLAHYDETGRLPVWTMQGNETNMMIGYHSVPVIVDAYFKGISFDASKAYEACKQTALSFDADFNFYQQQGYVPLDSQSEGENWAVSKTLEYAYDDWCIAQFAKALGKESDYQYFLNRGQNWKKLYDEQTGFFRPKDSRGRFLSNFKPKDYSPYFCESNAWQYFWSAPHDLQGLIAKVGGDDAFEKKLDLFFSLKPTADEKLPIFSTGMIGQYVHGNEPSHHVAYLYNEIGKPWKTQAMVRKIATSKYHNRPDGHCGNEDCGQMSSWYVWSSLGLYPVNPCGGVYAIGSPLFDRATIKLSNGKTFKIKTENNGKNRIFVQSIFLNGKPFKQLYLTHKEILKGGTLTLVMGDKPCEELGAYRRFSRDGSVKISNQKR